MTLPRITGAFGVVSDPEIRFTDSGNSVTKLRLVANKRVRDSNGTWTDGPTPLFIDAVAFGKIGEHLCDSVAKGDQVVVDGALEQQEWADKETGEKRTKVQIVIDEVGVSTRWGTAKSERVAGTSGGGSQHHNQQESDPSGMPF